MTRGCSDKRPLNQAQEYVLIHVAMLKYNAKSMLHLVYSIKFKTWHLKFYFTIYTPKIECLKLQTKFCSSII